MAKLDEIIIFILRGEIIDSPKNRGMMCIDDLVKGNCHRKSVLNHLIFNKWSLITL